MAINVEEILASFEKYDNSVTVILTFQTNYRADHLLQYITNTIVPLTSHDFKDAVLTGISTYTDLETSEDRRERVQTVVTKNDDGTTTIGPVFVNEPAEAEAFSSENGGILVDLPVPVAYWLTIGLNQ